MVRVLLLVLGFAACLPPAEAEGDWLFAGFIGTKFAGQTAFIGDTDRAAGTTKLTVGGSVALLGSGALGIEADVGYTPGFFETDTPSALSIPPPPVLGSHVTTLMGTVIVAVPLSVTRESLRPYLVGGLGLMHATITHLTVAQDLFNVDSKLFGMTLGGGAIGGLTPRTSIRFDIRQFRSLTRDESAARSPLAEGRDLTFWRASVGLTIGY